MSKDSDGFVKYTLEGSVGLIVSENIFGLTSDEIIGSEDSYNLSEAYDEARNLLNDELIHITEIIIRPDGTIAIKTNYQDIEGEPAKKI